MTSSRLLNMIYITRKYLTKNYERTSTNSDGWIHSNSRTLTHIPTLENTHSQNETFVQNTQLRRTRAMLSPV